MTLYEAIVLIHVVAIVVFAVAHIVSAVSMFQVRSTSDRAQLQAILGRSAKALTIATIAILIGFVAGLVLGFMGSWWGSLWIWVSLVLLIVVGGAMTPLAAIPMNGLRTALGMRLGRAKAGEPDPVPQDDATVAAARAALRPELVAAIGVAGFVAITWLMQAKPF
jgi:small-conductance mechanosensitive channel